MLSFFYCSIVWVGCSFWWCWWNCWPSLFKFLFV